MLDGTRFEGACRYCAMRLVVDRIRNADVGAMTEHLRERHPRLPLAKRDVLGHFRVEPPRS